MTAIPWSHTDRPDTGTSNTRLAMWLFLASEAMLFGSLFSGYVLLRSGSQSWPDATVLNARHALMMTPVLLAATLVFGYRGAHGNKRLIGSTVLFSAFIAMKVLDYRDKTAVGLHPANDLLLACWFTITAIHALHVGAGVVANLWAAAGIGRDPARDRERFRVLGLYWYFVDIVWFAILVGFYLV